MANIKISLLPSYTGSAADLRWFIMNDSGNTETFKYSGYSSPFRYLDDTLKNSAYLGTFADNTITSSGTDNIILNGQSNVIQSNATKTAVIAATSTNMYGGSNVFIAGGTSLVSDSAQNSGIIGGTGSYVNGTKSFIGGGETNNISNGFANGIIGGVNNQLWEGRNFAGGGYSNLLFAYTNSNDCGFLGGYNNEIQATSSRSTILGGINNTINTSVDSSMVGGSGSTLSGHNYSVMLGCVDRVSVKEKTTHVENLVVFNYAALNFVDDTAAAAGGVVLGQVYHNNGAMRIRIV